MTEHYFTNKPESRLVLQDINVRIFDTDYRFLTSSGLFSKERLDKGSRILIENAIVEGKDVLDLGCGYGIVGILLSMHHKADYHFSDVNPRAISLAKKNCKNYGLRAMFYVSDGFEKIDKRFDTILLNPPQTAGREVCEKLIEQSFKHLNDDGIFQTVIRHNKGGKTLSVFQEEIFGNVKALAKQGGYRIYLSRK